jgi:hypothetical protein
MPGPLTLMIATEAYQPGVEARDTPGARAHLARSKYAPALCGFDMLYSAGVPRLVAEDELLNTRCARCAARKAALAAAEAGLPKPAVCSKCLEVHSPTCPVILGRAGTTTIY